MDIQKERELFLAHMRSIGSAGFMFELDEDGNFDDMSMSYAWSAWQAAKTQAVPAQLDVNSILHDIDCYFDNSLSNTERTANNLLQSIYERLSGEVEAQEPK